MNISDNNMTILINGNSYKGEILYHSGERKHIPDSINTWKLVTVSEPYCEINLQKGFNLITIEKVIFNDPATIVLWKDGTKTVVKCQPGDTYDAEKGLALCIAKKALGNKGNFNEVFKKWIPKNVEPVKEDFLSKILNLVPYEKPKYYNGRIVFTKVDNVENNYITKGKIYEVKDGRITLNDGSKWPLFNRFETFSDLKDYFRVSEVSEVKEKTVDEMRQELYRFCADTRICKGCIFAKGWSCCFTDDESVNPMSDEEIKKAYELLEEYKEEKQNG